MRLSVSEKEWLLRAFCGGAVLAAVLMADFALNGLALRAYYAEIYLIFLLPVVMFWRAPSKSGGRIGAAESWERVLAHVFFFFLITFAVHALTESGEDAAGADLIYTIACWNFPFVLASVYITGMIWDYPAHADANISRTLIKAFMFAAVWASLALAWVPGGPVAEDYSEAAEFVLFFVVLFLAALAARRWFGAHAAAPPGAPRFAFRGNGAEYFKICAVNFLLSAVTLGGYSPWAKIRAKNYIYGNTFLDGANFEYRPNPWAIFCARLIIIPALVFWQDIYDFAVKILDFAKQYFSQFAAQDPAAVDEIYNGARILLAALFLLAYVALFLRGLSFNARVSWHRNVAFSFRRGRHFPIFLAMLLGVIIAGGWLHIAIHLVAEGLTAKVGGYSGCGALNHGFCIQQNLANMTPEYSRFDYYAPFVWLAAGVLAFLFFFLRAAHGWMRMRADNFSWGGVSFRFDGAFAKTAAVFGIALAPVWAAYAALLAAVLELSFGSAVNAGYIFSLLPQSDGASYVDSYLALLSAFAHLPFYFLFVFVYLSSFGFKYFWANVAFSGGRVRCGFSAPDYMWRIVFVNAAALVLSLGVLAPWARIRRARYLAARMWLEADAGVLARQKPEGADKTGALGGETADAAGFDIALV